MNDEIISIETNQTGIRRGYEGREQRRLSSGDHALGPPEKIRPGALPCAQLHLKVLETIRQNIFSLLFKREMSLYSNSCET